MVVRSALLPFWNRVLPESRNREHYTWCPGAKNSWPFQIDVSDRVITQYCCSGVSLSSFGGGRAFCSSLLQIMPRFSLFPLLGSARLFVAILHPGCEPHVTNRTRTEDTPQEVKNPFKEDQKHWKTTTWRQLGKSTTRKNARQSKKFIDRPRLIHLSIFVQPSYAKKKVLTTSPILILHRAKKTRTKIHTKVSLKVNSGGHLDFPFTCPSHNFCKHRQSQFFRNFWCYCWFEPKKYKHFHQPNLDFYTNLIFRTFYVCQLSRPQKKSLSCLAVSTVSLSLSVPEPGQAPTSLPGPLWLYLCESVQPARPPLMTAAASTARSQKFRTAAASPPLSAAAATFPTRSRKFSSSSASRSPLFFFSWHATEISNPHSDF